jgi:hypothetical protein
MRVGARIASLVVSAASCNASTYLFVARSQGENTFARRDHRTTGL